MNPFVVARQLRDRIKMLDNPFNPEVQLKIYATTDEQEDLKGKLPAVAIEVEESVAIAGVSKAVRPVYHTATVHCIVTAQRVAFDDACDHAVVLAEMVMKQMHGLQMRVKSDSDGRQAIGYAGYMVGGEKARAAVLECEIYD